MLSAIGLLLDILGAVLIYSFAIVPKVSREVEMGSLTIPNVSDAEKVRIKARADRNDRLSFLGIFFLVAGFVFQLMGNEYVRGMNW